MLCRGVETDSQRKIIKAKCLFKNRKLCVFEITTY